MYSTGHFTGIASEDNFILGIMSSGDILKND